MICRKKERDPGDSNTNPGIKGANLKEKCASGMRMRIFLNNEDSLFITLSPPPVRLAGKLFTSIILLLLFKVSLWMFAGRAVFQGFFAFVMVSAMAANPDNLFVFFKHLVIVQVFE